MFKLEFTTDNAAFGDEPADECARILRKLADKLEHSGTRYADMPVKDLNGNRIGRLLIDTVEGD